MTATAAPFAPTSDSSAAPATGSAAAFAALMAGVAAACTDGARRIADEIEACLPDAGTLLAMLSEDGLAGSEAGYCRHLVYADPLARFSAMLLVWRPGQATPVHGHRTWCSYRVLKGTLRETHYRWDESTLRAHASGGIERQPGASFTVPAGLRHIHGLTNASNEIAVSLHIYGVPSDAISTGVNLIVEAA